MQINKYTLCTSPPSTTSWTITIPAATPIMTLLYTTITGTFCDGDLLSADILASDGQPIDTNGIAAITIEWEP